MNEFSVIKTPSGGKILIYGKLYNALTVVDYDGNYLNGNLEQEEWVALKNDRDSKFAWHGEYQVENGKMYGKVIPKLERRRSHVNGDARNSMHVNVLT